MGKSETISEFIKFLHNYSKGKPLNIAGFINAIQSANNKTDLLDGAFHVCRTMLHESLVGSWGRLVQKGSIEIPVSFKNDTYKKFISNQVFYHWDTGATVSLSSADVFSLNLEHDKVLDIVNQSLFNIETQLKGQNISITFIIDHDEKLLQQRGGITISTCGEKDGAKHILPITHQNNSFPNTSSGNLATICLPFWPSFECTTVNFARNGSACQFLIHYNAVHEIAHALGMRHYDYFGEDIPQDSTIIDSVRFQDFWNISIMAKPNNISTEFEQRKQDFIDKNNSCKALGAARRSDVDNVNYYHFCVSPFSTLEDKLENMREDLYSLLGHQLGPLDLFLLYVGYHYHSCQNFVNQVSNTNTSIVTANITVNANLSPFPMPIFATNDTTEITNTVNTTTNAKVPGATGLSGITGASFGFEEIQVSGATSASSSAWFNWGILYPFFSVLRTPSPFMILEKNGGSSQCSEEKQEAKQGAVIGHTIEIPYQDTRSVVQSLDGNIGLFAVMAQRAVDAWNWWVMPKKPPVVYMEEKAFERNLYRCEHYLRAIKSQLNESHSFIEKMRKIHAISVYNFAKQQLTALQDAYDISQEAFKGFQENGCATTEEMRGLLQDLEYLKTDGFIEAREDIKAFIKEQKSEAKFQNEMHSFFKRHEETLSLVVGYRPAAIFSPQVSARLSSFNNTDEVIRTETIVIKP